MHSSVLQNKKYIEFADESTVEVMALQRLDEGISKNDPKAATYDAKDENGNPVKYLLEFPNLTVEEVLALNSSPAGQYNDTGRIPYTCIVDPYTLKKMQCFGGGQSAKTIMEAALAAKTKLEAEHGASTNRKTLKAVQAEAKEVRETLAKDGAAKAFGAFAKLEKLVAKEGDNMKQRAEEVRTVLMEAAGAELDKAEELIGGGNLDEAKKLLTPLARVLKKTDLELRVNELLEKTKGE
jgi:hypothetical protein